MMGKKALIIRLVSLRREDMSMLIMNQEQAIAKEKSSLKGVLRDNPIILRQLLL